MVWNIFIVTLCPINTSTPPYFQLHNKKLTDKVFTRIVQESKFLFEHPNFKQLQQVVTISKGVEEIPNYA